MVSPLSLHCHQSPNLDLKYLILLSLCSDSSFVKFKIGREKYQHTFCIISRDTHTPLLCDSHLLLVDPIAVPSLRSPLLAAAIVVDEQNFYPSHVFLYILHETAVFYLLFNSSINTFHVLLCKKCWSRARDSWEALYQENSDSRSIRSYFIQQNNPRENKCALLPHIPISNMPK